jgi:predicted TIM-barrel fold metal-dependent hydrolase
VIDDDVPAFWRRLGLPGLADVHTHFLPERMLRKVWAQFDAAGPLIGRPWPIRYRGTDAERVATLRRLGVRSFSALGYAHKPAMSAWLNDWTLAFASEVPECLPSATFFPEEGAADVVRSALDRGARIFKLHLQVGGFDPRDPLLTPAWDLLASAGTPVVVHAGSGPVASGFTGAGPIGEVLARHPSLVLIFAHLGAPEYGDFLDLATAYPNVCLDTTMALTDFWEELAPFPRSLLPRLRDLGPAGRILLGTDFPNIPYAYAHQLESLARLNLGDDWLRAVCWGNAAGMFGLSQ